jgi:ribosomal protein L13
MRDAHNKSVMIDSKYESYGRMASATQFSEEPNYCAATNCGQSVAASLVKIGSISKVGYCDASD